MNRIVSMMDFILTKIARFLLNLLTGLENFLLKMPQNNINNQLPEPAFHEQAMHAAFAADGPNKTVKVSTKETVPRIPKFKPGDIVYVKFNPNQLGNGAYYPMIGGHHEVDCKVIYVISADHNIVEYNLMSGTGTRIEIREECLISASEYIKEKTITVYILKNTYELSVSGSWIKIEANTSFNLIGEWITSDHYGINIHISYFEKHLTELFDAVPGTSM